MSVMSSYAASSASCHLARLLSGSIGLKFERQERLEAVVAIALHVGLLTVIAVNGSRRSAESYREHCQEVV